MHARVTRRLCMIVCLFLGIGLSIDHIATSGQALAAATDGQSSSGVTGNDGRIASERVRSSARIDRIRRGVDRLAAAGGRAGAMHAVDAATPAPQPDPPVVVAPVEHKEMQHDLPAATIPLDNPLARSPRMVVERDGYVSVQVNVDDFGNNIVGDAANEPSLAVDPLDHNRIAIGWRQFNSIASDFRQAGWAYTDDGGQSWSFPGVLQPGVFRSDPLLESDADGDFYYNSLRGNFLCDVFKSTNGGASWGPQVPAFGGDKAWMDIDRTNGIGRGNIYVKWQSFANCCGLDTFTRSTNGGASFETPVAVPNGPSFGTVAVGPNGEVYVAGIRATAGQEFNVIVFAKSLNANNPAVTPTFPVGGVVDLGGSMSLGTGPNPAGLLGQVWVAVDHSDGPTRGYVYMLASLNPPGNDPMDVFLIRSTNGGVDWSAPLRINTDPQQSGVYQWFGTLSVAPNGRVDVIFNDTRNDPFGQFSELYYTFSEDGGLSFAPEAPVSPAFNHFDGYPVQQKLGDYYDMISDEHGVDVAYAATFNGEQDVYYLRIGAFDCNENDIPDDCDVDCLADGGDCNIPGCGESEDCNDNGFPDECEESFGLDCNKNGTTDFCDIASGGSDDVNGNLVPDECEEQEVVYVDTANCPGPGIGTEGDPFCTIQDALDAAGTGENKIVVVSVADGVYAGPGNRDVSFLGKAVTLRGANGPANCVIDCQGAGRGVLFESGESAGSRLEGVTIRNGAGDIGAGIRCFLTSPTIKDCVIEQCEATAQGGGIAALLSSPTIDGCTVRDNQAAAGGGLYVVDGDVEMTESHFEGNMASSGDGGAVLGESGGNLSATDTVFVGNQASSDGGAVFGDVSDTLLAGCLLDGNSAGQNGGGVFVRQGDLLQIDRCAITNNTSLIGGGISLSFVADAVITNSLVASNESTSNGGGIASNGVALALINDTLVDNAAGGKGGGLSSGDDDATMVNSIAWGNTATNGGDQLRLVVTNVAVSYSDVQGGEAGVLLDFGGELEWGVGNIDADPLFVDPVGGDLHISAGSPVIDAASNSAVVAGATLDLDGNARFVDDPNTVDTGEGVAPIVDMGAYELQPAPLLLSASSCRIHAAGLPQEAELCIDLAASNGVEPRLGGIGKLVFAFGEPIDEATVDCANVQIDCTVDGAAACASATLVGGDSTVEVTLAGPVADVNCCTIGFAGMQTQGGAPIPDTQDVYPLAGDIDFSGFITGGDFVLIKPHFGEQVGIDLVAPQYDFDRNGGVTGGDALLIKPLFGHVAPACP